MSKHCRPRSSPTLGGTGLAQQAGLAMAQHRPRSSICSADSRDKEHISAQQGSRWSQALGEECLLAPRSCILGRCGSGSAAEFQQLHHRLRMKSQDPLHTCKSLVSVRLRQDK